MVVSGIHRRRPPPPARPPRWPPPLLPALAWVPDRTLVSGTAWLAAPPPRPPPPPAGAPTTGDGVRPAPPRPYLVCGPATSPAAPLTSSPPPRPGSGPGPDTTVGSRLACSSTSPPPAATSWRSDNWGWSAARSAPPLSGLRPRHQPGRPAGLLPASPPRVGSQTRYYCRVRLARSSTHPPPATTHWRPGFGWRRRAARPAPPLSGLRPRPAPPRHLLHRRDSGFPLPRPCHPTTAPSPPTCWPRGTEGACRGRWRRALYTGPAHRAMV